VHIDGTGSTGRPRWPTLLRPRAHPRPHPDPLPMRWHCWMPSASPRQAAAPSRSFTASALTLGCCAAYKCPRPAPAPPSQAAATKLLEDLRCGPLEELRAALMLGARRADASPPAQGVARTEPSPSCNLHAGAHRRRKPTPGEEPETPLCVPRTWHAVDALTAGRNQGRLRRATALNACSTSPRDTKPCVSTQHAEQETAPSPTRSAETSSWSSAPRWGSGTRRLDASPLGLLLPSEPACPWRSPSGEAAPEKPRAS
jgi:hypothetical protein